MGFIDRQPAEGATSLHRDVAAGRPSEIDAWTGAVVRPASAAGIAAPVHGVLHELLGLRAERRAG